MILIDANILIYAFVQAAPQHVTAKAWLNKQLSDETAVGLPWNSLLAFARIVTNPRIFEKPASSQTAWKQIGLWLDSDVAWTPTPTEEHQAILSKIVETTSLSANDWPDAHLAALSLEHGLTVCSTDSDFGKYRDVRWHNPL